MPNVIDKNIVQVASNGQIISWEPLGAENIGKAVDVAAASAKTFQVSGTFGGAVVSLEGSVDGEHFHKLTDPQGNGLSKGQASIDSVEEHVAWIRPNVNGGSKDTKLSVNLLIKFER